jgi:hypothetical protein
MRFSINVYPDELEALHSSLVAITGQDPWERAADWVSKQLAANPFMREWLDERYIIAIKLRESLAERRRTGHIPTMARDLGDYRLVSFVTGVARAYEGLSAQGKARLRGMLLDGLKSDHGLLSLENEITTAMHLLSRGFDVEFHDMETGSGVDFIARNDGVEIEIECKMVSGDLGRKIHRLRALALFWSLAEIASRTYRSAIRGLMIRITVPERLTSSDELLRAIRDAFSRAIVSGHGKTLATECEIEVLDFDVAVSPFAVADVTQLSGTAIHEFVRARLGHTGAHSMHFFSPGRRALALAIESRKPDRVLAGIRRQLRDTAEDQFGGERPGIICVQFHDLSAEELQDLGESDSTERETATGLQIMTSDLLQDPKRTHIHSIAYRSHGKLLRSDGIVTERASSYVIRNRNNLLWDDPRYRVFT